MCVSVMYNTLALVYMNDYYFLFTSSLIHHAHITMSPKSDHRDDIDEGNEWRCVPYLRG